MYRVFVCDDDIEWGNRLKRSIEKHFENNDINVKSDYYESGEQLLMSDEIEECSAVFLDIEVGKENGIEIAKEFRDKNKRADIVFVTSFIQYCPSGYHLNAVRYLLKNDVHFNAALEECIKVLSEKEKVKDRKITVQTTDSIEILNEKSIAYIESKKHYLYFHMIDGKEYVVREKLSSIEKRIRDSGFIRIHESILVNLEMIKGIKRYEVSIDNDSLPIAKTRFSSVMKDYLSWKGNM